MVGSEIGRRAATNRALGSLCGDERQRNQSPEGTMISTRTILGIACALAASCGSGDEDTTVTTSESTIGDERPATFAAQVEWGGMLYGEHCARCHGDSGQGTSEAPMLVGIAAGALPLQPRPGSSRTTTFTTVADVEQFAVANMPPRAAGSLSEEAYFAILAFDLSANGITLDQPLTAELAPTITIPR